MLHNLDEERIRELEGTALQPLLLPPNNPNARMLFESAAQTSVDIIRSTCETYGVNEKIFFCISQNPRIIASAHMLNGGRKIILLGGLIMIDLMKIARHVYISNKFEEIHNFDAAKVRNSQDIKINSMLTDILHWIIWHELAHIIFGHIGILNARKQDIISEERSASRSVRRNITMQTFEMDADAFAVNQMMSYINKHTGEEKDYLLKKYITSVYITFSVFGLETNFDTNLFLHSHPFPAVRMMLMSGRIGDRLDMDDKYELVAKLMQQIINMTDEILFEIVGRNIDRRNHFAAAVVARDQSSLIVMKRCWSKLLPRLQRYKMGIRPLAPASFEWKQSDWRNATRRCTSGQWQETAQVFYQRASQRNP